MIASHEYQEGKCGFCGVWSTRLVYLGAKRGNDQFSYYTCPRHKREGHLEQLIEKFDVDVTVPEPTERWL